MRVLAFDTSGPWIAAGLLADDDFAARVETIAKGQAEALIPLLEALLTDHGLGWRDLDRIGVGTGPGNFTGTRIGVSAARGLALGLDRPAIGIGGLEALAFMGKVAALPAPRARSYRPGAGGQPVIAEEPSPEVPLEALANGLARLTAAASLPQPCPAPIYVRPADAAPPSDPPPVILPG